MSDIPPPRIKCLPFDDIPPPIKCLPFELIENILSRLPVKSLKRFRAVEKSWCRLIDSEWFAKTHLRRSLSSNSNRNLYSGFVGFYWISVDSLEKVHSYKPHFVYDDHYVESLSKSCNGLVVVMRSSEPLVLWNLFTREHKVLPKCPSDHPAELISHSRTLSGSHDCTCITRYGFGYDSRNDDYKVVQVMTYTMPPLFKLSDEWIYSLKSNSWRKTNRTSYERGHWEIHVNGALHTILQTEPGFGGMKIMAFSLQTEEEYELMMPVSPGIELKGLKNVCSANLDGCYAFACDYPSKVVIWVMKEYGVQESWTSLGPFPVEEGEFWRPLTYFKESDKILFNCTGKRFVMCDVRTTGVENFTLPKLFRAHPCVESLISPNGWVVGKSSTEKPNKDGQPNKGEKEMMQKKKRDGFLSSGFKLVL